MTEEKRIPGGRGGFLTPFRKGQVGNPKGKPKGYKSFKQKLREFAELEILRSSEEMGFDPKDFDSKKKRMEMGEAMIMRLFSAALGGDTKAAKLILEYAEDKKIEIVDPSSIKIDENASPEDAAAAYKELINS